MPPGEQPAGEPAAQELTEAEQAKLKEEQAKLKEEQAKLAAKKAFEEHYRRAAAARARYHKDRHPQVGNGEPPAGVQAVKAYQASPPELKELARGRRELKAELEKIAGRRIVLREEVPADTPVDFNLCFQQCEAVKGNRQQMAYVIGLQLELVKRLLLSDKPEVRLSALKIANQTVMRCALNFKHPRAGHAICQLYLLPNLGDAHAYHGTWPSRYTILKSAVAMALQSEDYPAMQTAAAWLWTIAHNRRTADYARRVQFSLCGDLS